MFDHVTIRVRDVERARPGYDALLGALGLEATGEASSFLGWGGFSVAPAGDGPPTSGRTTRSCARHGPRAAGAATGRDHDR